MLLSFFAILPHGPLRLSSADHQGYEEVEEEDTFDPDEETEPRSEHERLLASSMHSASGRSFTSVQSTTSGKDLSSAIVGFKANLRRAKGLFIP
jgi:battenin